MSTWCEMIDDYGLVRRRDVFLITTETGAMETQRRVQELKPVDAVEVVRCRDCKHWSGRNDKPHEVTVIGYCHHRNHLIMPIPASWYCADGKRRDGNV